MPTSTMPPRPAVAHGRGEVSGQRDGTDAGQLDLLERVVEIVSSRNSVVRFAAPAL